MESAPNTRMSNVRSSGGISTNPFDDLIDECPRSGNCGEGQAEPYSPIALSGLLGPNGMLWPAPNTSQPKELGSTTGRYQAVAEGLAERHTDAKPKCSQQEQVPTGGQQWGGADGRCGKRNIRQQWRRISMDTVHEGRQVYLKWRWQQQTPAVFQEHYGEGPEWRRYRMP